MLCNLMQLSYSLFCLTVRYKKLKSYCRNKSIISKKFIISMTKPDTVLAEIHSYPKTDNNKSGNIHPLSFCNFRVSFQGRSTFRQIPLGQVKNTTPTHRAFLTVPKVPGSGSIQGQSQSTVRPSKRTSLKFGSLVKSPVFLCFVSGQQTMLLNTICNETNSWEII